MDSTHNIITYIYSILTYPVRIIYNIFKQQTTLTK